MPANSKDICGLFAGYIHVYDIAFELSAGALLDELAPICGADLIQPLPLQVDANAIIASTANSCDPC